MQVKSLPTKRKDLGLLRYGSIQLALPMSSPSKQSSLNIGLHIIKVQTKMQLVEFFPHHKGLHYFNLSKTHNKGALLVNVKSNNKGY